MGVVLSLCGRCIVVVRALVAVVCMLYCRCVDVVLSLCGCCIVVVGTLLCLCVGGAL